MRDYLILTMEREDKVDFNRVLAETHTAYYEIKGILNKLGQIDEKDHHCRFRDTGKTVFLERV